MNKADFNDQLKEILKERSDLNNELSEAKVKGKPLPLPPRKEPSESVVEWTGQAKSSIEAMRAKNIDKWNSSLKSKEKSCGDIKNQKICIGVEKTYKCYWDTDNKCKTELKPKKSIKETDEYLFMNDWLDGSLEQYIDNKTDENFRLLVEKIHNFVRLMLETARQDTSKIEQYKPLVGDDNKTIKNKFDELMWTVSTTKGISEHTKMKSLKGFIFISQLLKPEHNPPEEEEVVEKKEIKDCGDIDDPLTCDVSEYNCEWIGDTCFSKKITGPLKITAQIGEIEKTLTEAGYEKLELIQEVKDKIVETISDDTLPVLDMLSDALTYLNKDVKVGTFYIFIPIDEFMNKLKERGIPEGSKEEYNNDILQLKALAKQTAEGGRQFGYQMLDMRDIF